MQRAHAPDDPGAATVDVEVVIPTHNEERALADLRGVGRLLWETSPARLRRA